MHIKKRKKIDSDVPSADILKPSEFVKTESLKPSEVPKADAFKPSGFKGIEMGAIARLRAAKKVKEEAQVPREKKLVGEVELGPTETQETVIKRIKKRSK